MFRKLEGQAALLEHIQTIYLACVHACIFSTSQLSGAATAALATPLPTTLVNVMRMRLCGNYRTGILRTVLPSKHYIHEID